MQFHFLFGQNLTTHTKLIESKTWLSFLVGNARGRAPLLKKIVFNTQFNSLFGQKSTTAMVTIFSLRHFFSKHYFSAP